MTAAQVELSLWFVLSLALLVYTAIGVMEYALDLRDLYRDPKVTRDPAKEDHAAGVMWVGRFKGADRIAYLIGCNNADSEQAKLFRIARDESGDDVSDREDREVVQDAPERPARDLTAPINIQPAVQY